MKTTRVHRYSKTTHSNSRRTRCFIYLVNLLQIIIELTHLIKFQINKLIFLKVLWNEFGIKTCQSISKFGFDFFVLLPNFCNNRQGRQSCIPWSREKKVNSSARQARGNCSGRIPNTSAITYSFITIIIDNILGRIAMNYNNTDI